MSPDPPSSSTPPRRASASTEVAKTGRVVADATVTKVSNYKRRIAANERPNALPPPPIIPDSPPAPTTPPPPAGPRPPGRVNATNHKPPRSSPKTIAQASGSAYANDFSGVLGKAKKKIEDAINEANQQQ